ncbi:MAG: hypothetical protein ABH878_09210 [bacterium]
MSGASVRYATANRAGESRGIHEVTFDGSQLPSGVYFYRLQARDFTVSGKMLLLK